MSLLPKVAGQSCWGAGLVGGELVVAWAAARQVSIAAGVDQLPGFPPAVEYENNTCSWLRPSRPSAQALTISFVAPAPVGAPFAMLTLGEAERSFRAPAMPSSTQRSPDPSKLRLKHGSVIR